MYEKAMLMFLYADAPVHLGAGISLGAVDLPVQRERHTQYPMAQGSGLKGALRHHLWCVGQNRSEKDNLWSKKLEWVFGPGDEEEQGRPQDHAGAVAFGDGRLLLFPVRSLVGTFAYCTSAVALGRLRRDLDVVGLQAGWNAPVPPQEGRGLAPQGSKVVTSNKAILEDFDLAVEESEPISRIASWIGDAALPAGPAFGYFRDRVKTHLLVVSDELFSHLTRLATVVEPHVKINDDTGTAEGTAFFYAEHLPPDTLMYSLVGLAKPRARREDKESIEGCGLTAAAMIGDYLKNELDGRPVQIGAHATTGRGLVHLRFVGGGR